MTHDPYASVHLGLLAEAMLLIDPPSGARTRSARARQAGLLPVIFLVLLLLLPGAPIVQESGFGQLARALECASRCNTPSVHTPPGSTLSR